MKQKKKEKKKRRSRLSPGGEFRQIVTTMGRLLRMHAGGGERVDSSSTPPYLEETKISNKKKKTLHRLKACFYLDLNLQAQRQQNDPFSLSRPKQNLEGNKPKNHKKQEKKKKHHHHHHTDRLKAYFFFFSWIGTFFRRSNKTLRSVSPPPPPFRSPTLPPLRDRPSTTVAHPTGYGGRHSSRRGRKTCPSCRRGSSPRLAAGLPNGKSPEGGGG